MPSLQDYFIAENTYLFPRAELVPYAHPLYWIGQVIAHRTAGLKHATFTCLQSAQGLRPKSIV